MGSVSELASEPSAQSARQLWLETVEKHRDAQEGPVEDRYWSRLDTASRDELAAIHAGLVAGLETGTLKPAIGQEFPLEQASRAHVAVMESGAHGKIVLTIEA